MPPWRVASSWSLRGLGGAHPGPRPIRCCSPRTRAVSPHACWTSSESRGCGRWDVADHHHPTACREGGQRAHPPGSTHRAARPLTRAPASVCACRSSPCRAQLDRHCAAPVRIACCPVHVQGGACPGRASSSGGTETASCWRRPPPTCRDRSPAVLRPSHPSRRLVCRRSRIPRPMLAVQVESRCPPGSPQVSVSSWQKERNDIFAYQGFNLFKLQSGVMAGDMPYHLGDDSYCREGQHWLADVFSFVHCQKRVPRTAMGEGKAQRQCQRLVYHRACTSCVR